MATSFDFRRVGPRAGRVVVRALQVVGLAWLVAGCGDRPARDDGAAGASAVGGRWTPAMRTELLSRVTKDQVVREQFVAALRTGTPPLAEAAARLAAVDSANLAWFGDIVAREGWPDRAAVGEEGVQAAFLLVQHADRDTAFQARLLPAIEAAWRRGQADAQMVALLSDRLAVARGLGQTYGTQAKVLDGRIVFDAIADSERVDERRARMGLGGLEAYRRVLDSVYLKGDK